MASVAVQQLFLQSWGLTYNQGNKLESITKHLLRVVRDCYITDVRQNIYAQIHFVNFSDITEGRSTNETFRINLTVAILKVEGFGMLQLNLDLTVNVTIWLWLENLYRGI